MKITSGLRYVWYLSTRKKAKPDSFINWLRFANAGMLNEGNIYCFQYVAERLPSESPIVEVGSFCGLSTNIINYYLRKSNRTNKLITCDNWYFEGVENQDALMEWSNITHYEYRQFVMETYIRNVSFFSQNRIPHTIACFSNDFFELWRKETIATDVTGRDVKLGGKISFAYIDGNHTYPYVKNDFLNVDKYLETDGFILFDDSADYYTRFGVNRLVREIKKMNNYEVVIKNPNYLFKKIG